MSVDQMNNHYSMNNPASIYDEEALTTLELVGRLAKKVVEIIDLVNKNELTVEEAVEQFKKDYNEAKEYMVDNLPEFVENSVENLKNSGDLETMLVKAISSTKLDKNGVESITYSMLSQQIKEMFTGGNTPVVGNNSVSTSNIVNNSVSEEKIHKNMRALSFYHKNEEKAYYTPVITLKASDFSAVVSTTYDIVLSSSEKNITVSASSLLVDTTGWYDSKGQFDMYYDDTINTIKVVNPSKSSDFANYYYLGGVRTYSQTNIIPVAVDGAFYAGNTLSGVSDLPLCVRRCSYYSKTLAQYNPADALFDYNFDTATLTLLKTSGTNQIQCEGRYYSVNLKTLQCVVEVPANVSNAGVWWCPSTNTLTIRRQLSGANQEHANELFCGVIVKPSVTAGNTCIFPHTLSNGAYYVHPNHLTRPTAQLMLTSETVTGSTMVAKVDFKGRRLIIPARTALTYILGKEYIHVENDNTENDIVIPFADSTSQYNYLVGGINGLKLVDHEEFINVANIRDVNQLYYCGYINMVSKTFDLTCKAEKMRTYAILGDSISTYEGVCPSEHTVYYTGNNAGITTPQHTWWGRVADRCGLELTVNMAWSGLRVTPRSGNPERDGVYFADSIAQYTGDVDPDIIFVYMGINDFNHNTPLGEWDRKAEVDMVYDCSQTHYFIESYAKMLSFLKRTHPDSEVYCLTLPNCERSGSTTSEIEINENGTALWEYNEAIRMVCQTLGVNVIDTDTCNFNHWNSMEYFTDFNLSTAGFLHPNAEGMKVIANKVIKAILDTKECD